MKLNSTVALTLSLLILMLGAGYISAIWGFAVGHEAVKGVTQPDGRSTGKFKLRKATAQQQRSVVMLEEEDILATVKARIDGKGKKARPEKPQPENKDNPFSKDKPVSQNTPDEKNHLAQQTFQPGFPVTNKNQGVTLELLDVKKISMSLSDYPEQQLRLRMSDIPITR